MLLNRHFNVAASSLQRCFSTTNHRLASRYYRYAIDVHGQLFLHDTTPKNLTSCFKNLQFLDFFFARIKPNLIDEKKREAPLKGENDEETLKDPDWTEKADLTEQEATRLAILDGYNWVSPCQGELNFIRAATSPIVFRELDEQGNLRWAGTYTSRFDPSSLMVHSETGYVYHPSPLSPLRSARRKVDEQGSKANSYGEYSLLSSALVLQRLATGLDIDPDAFADGKGGSIEWKGKRWDMGILSEGQVRVD